MQGQHRVWKTNDKCDTLVSDRCGISGVANAVGNEMRMEVWERHGSGCNVVTRLAGVPQMYANGVCT